jgi:hypothetical protein
MSQLIELCRNDLPRIGGALLARDKSMQLFSFVAGKTTTTTTTTTTTFMFCVDNDDF